MSHFCHRCLYKSEHPFGLTFDEHICLGCITHEEKVNLDWDNRKSKLIELSDKLRKRKSRSGYSCVIPVTGVAEDYFTVTKVLELGLNPLIVAVNNFFYNDIGWHNLHQLITYFDLDSLVFNPELSKYKELIRVSLRKYNHIYWPYLALATSFPVHIAKQRKIPLIVWGQNQAIEQVGKFSHVDEVEMSEWSRQEHDLAGISLDSLLGNGAQVNTSKLGYYHYPDISALSKSGIKGIYLSNYLPWDPLFQNSQAVAQGFKAEKNNYSFDTYERAGSSVYYKLHDLLKFKRIGYRKITDHLSREIRHGRASREQAREIEKRYSENPVDIKPFFDWLGVTNSGFKWFVEHKLSDIKHLIGEEEVVDIRLPNELSSLIERGSSPNEEFMLFGKGISI